MAESKHQAFRTVVIGDLVGSRRAADRRTLHDRLADQLVATTRRFAPPEALRITVGDEFQGVFTTLGAALTALVDIQVALLPAIDVRFGVGRGDLEVFDEGTRTQDGPAWWAARDAIEVTESLGDQAATRAARITYRSAVEDGRQPAVNAALLCRDHMVGSLDDRSLRILRGLMDDRTQADLATDEGISPAAVSQRVRNHGLEVILRAQRELAALA